MHNYYKNKGYSLLEVMVAVVIMSIGLTALGLLQVANVQNSYNANNRAVAAMAAQSMADRIRANLSAYESGTFANVAGTAGVLGGCSDGTGATTCTAQQMAQDDLARWQAELATTLPQGGGVVCVDDGQLDDGNPGAPQCSGNGNTVVKVFWRETAGFSSTTNADDVNNQWQAFGIAVYP